MEKWQEKIVVKKNEEKIFSLDDAARLAMKKNNSSGCAMKECIVDVSNETGWDASDIGSTLANWKKPETNPEIKEEKEKRDIALGDAYLDENGNIEYLDDRSGDR